MDITINYDNIKLEQGWKEVLKEEFNQPYFLNIKKEILAAKERGEKVFPPSKMIFNAFDTTPFTEVKAVIIGQDPYHKQGQAMGLSFSVPQGVKVPPSLRNIYKELARSYEYFQIPDNGDLSAWAKQGVLLLNASLTVVEGRANSHAQIGWQQFTDAAIRALSDKRDNIVFMLWGNFAKSKSQLINRDKHLVLEAVHPSPLAPEGFIGCNHFVYTNEFLTAHGNSPIDWQISSVGRTASIQSAPKLRNTGSLEMMFG